MFKRSNIVVLILSLGPASLFIYLWLYAYLAKHYSEEVAFKSIFTLGLLTFLGFVFLIVSKFRKKNTS